MMRPFIGILCISLFCLVHGARVDSGLLIHKDKTFKDRKEIVGKQLEETTVLPTKIIERSVANTGNHEWLVKMSPEIFKKDAAFRGVVENGKIILKNSERFSFTEFEDLYSLLEESFTATTAQSFDSDFEGIDHEAISTIQNNAKDVLTLVRDEYLRRKHMKQGGQDNLGMYAVEYGPKTSHNVHDFISGYE